LGQHWGFERRFYKLDKTRLEKGRQKESFTFESEKLFAIKWGAFLFGRCTAFLTTKGKGERTPSFKDQPH